jgi:hypothetical protein
VSERSRQRRLKTLLVVGVAALTTVGTLLATAGVGFAAETKWVRARLHWNMNLTDVERNINCPKTSSQIAFIPPDSRPSEWYVMVAASWEQHCGDAHSRMMSKVRRTEDGKIEFHIDWRVWGNGDYPPQYTMIFQKRIGEALTAFDRGWPAGDMAAYGHFAASIQERDAYEPRMVIHDTDHEWDDVKANVQLELYRTGQYLFKGWIENRNGGSRNVKMTCAVITTNGNAWIFEIAKDRVGGLKSLGGGGQRLTWNIPGEGHDIDLKIDMAFKRNQLNENSPINCAMSVNADFGGGVNEGALITEYIQHTF